uniref:Formamidopyrimidine-DNA glycosylase catalytic domain-containing protein n=1 Tax=viral metagenome TaxID=1070528 RepID=A0A6C0KR68_9ZZZZ
MTEGPEATYLAHYIATYFKNKRLKQVSIRGGRYKHHGPPKGLRQFPLPLRLLDVHKKGKVIFFLFEHQWCMIAKMGMVGWFSKPEEKGLFQSHPNVIFHFENGDLHFFDFRNFGTLTFTDNPIKIVSELDAIAPDIHDTSPSALEQRVHDIVEHYPHETLEIALMNQERLFSGIGNIIKSELLYHAKLSPKRPLSSLSKKEWHRLILSSKKVYNTILNYLYHKGLDFNGYFDLHNVYQKEKDPNGLRVISYKVKDGRTTFWVPSIQQ